MPISNAAIVILGASGDLARRKLVPALSRLCERGELEAPFVVVGSGRTAFTDEQFRERFKVPAEFGQCMFYHQGIAGLRGRLEKLGAFERIVVFMSLQPSVYGQTAAELAAEGLRERTSLIIEKPFGYDYDTALALNSELHRSYPEESIYRIDHYLAKEAVQNILVFRFANSIFYPVWNSNYISSIQINASEEIGVEDRGAYFDGAGIIRDMVQNHLVQLLCLLTMESPVSLAADDIRLQKLCILKALRVSSSHRAQYEGYRSERNVAPGSTTETYAELKLFIDTFRWTGMPVHIRCGKGLNRKGTEIGVRFKSPPRLLFNANGDLPPNRIIFKIQPSEGIVMDLSSKVPGGEMLITGTNMAFCYRDHFAEEIPEAYQRLLLDALKGDRTLFVSAEETELSWKAFGPFLGRGEVATHKRGTLPLPKLYTDWIDFETYGSVCG
jgi:glucose-6-phosphate 1-dehydrogenase